MPKPAQHDIYLELSIKKVFAVSIHWPGWSRSGRDEEAAIQSLIVYGARYSRALESTDLQFIIPETAADFNITERVKGNLTTDFGAPNLPIRCDNEAINPTELQRLVTILKAAWRAFDRAASAAEGKELRKGPRGGGRDLEKIIAHVAGAETGYLKALGWSVKKIDEADLTHQVEFIRSEVISGLHAAVAGQLPTVGPRGARRWSPSYFVRRLGWHVLDHAWEIEDRIM